jgi:hypothetical protein
MATIISYEKFMELVPERTKNYVNSLLPHIKRHFIDGYRFYFNNSDNSWTSKELFLMALNSRFLNEFGTELTVNTLRKYNFNHKALKLTDPGITTNKETFEEAIHLFCICKEINDYNTLTPEQIAKNHNQIFANSEHYHYQYISDIVSYIFSGENDYYNYNQELNNVIVTEKNNIVLEMKNKLYDGLNIEVISFLEKVSKTHSYIKSTMKNHSLLAEKLETEADISVLAMLVSLPTMPNLSQIWLENNGITNKEIYKYLGTELNQNNIDKKAFDITILKEYYQKLIFEGENNNSNPSKITIDSIASNLFKRSTNNNSLLLERIMLSCGCTKTFENYSKELLNITLNDEEKEKKESEKKAFSNFSEDVITYITLVTKIYTLLVKKMDENKYNENILKSDDDVIIISLLLASYFTPNKVNSFFIEKNITTKKIFELIGISITKEELDKEFLNIDILTKHFDHFIHGGINERKNDDKITVDSIAKNMTSREFNNSRAISTLYHKLTGIALPVNFLSELEKHIAKMDFEKQKTKEQEFFGTMPAGTIAQLFIASKIYQYIEDVKPNTYTEKDMAIISLITSLGLGGFEEYEVYIRLGLETQKIANYLGFSLSKKKIDSFNNNIEILESQFKDFIMNNDTEKYKLTNKELAKNILVNTLSNTILMRQLLDNLKVDSEVFNKFDEILETIRKEREGLEELSELKYFFEDLPGTTDTFIRAASKVCKVLEEKVDENNITSTSILITLFLTDNIERTFFEKKGIDLDKILEKLKLKTEDFKNYQYEHTDINVLKKYFSNYVFKTHEFRWDINIDDLALKLFNADFTNNTLIEELVDENNINVELLQRELYEGKEITEEKTDEQLIKEIRNMEISPLTDFDMVSILNFGNELLAHTKIISDKYSKIISDSEISTVSEITPLLDDVVVVEKVESKNFFLRFFGLGEEEMQKLDGTAIDKVQYALKDKADTLQEYVIGFEFLCDYLSSSIFQVQKVLKMLKEYIESITEKIKQNEGDDVATLKYNSINKALSSRGKLFYETLATQKAQWALLYTASASFIEQIGELTSYSTNMIPLLEMKSSISTAQENQTELMNKGIALISELKNSLEQSDKKRLSSNTFSESELKRVTQEIMVEQNDDSKATLDMTSFDIPNYENSFKTTDSIKIFTKK